MAELKTKKTAASVESFLNGVADAKQRGDAFKVLALMKEVTGEEPKMWGPSIIGFGDYRCVYDSGRELDWFRTGFSPRKGNLVLYVMANLPRPESWLKKLGKCSAGKGCLYIKKLEDVDLDVLREMIELAVTNADKPVKKKAPAKKAGKK